MFKKKHIWETLKPRMFGTNAPSPPRKHLPDISQEAFHELVFQKQAARQDEAAKDLKYVSEFRKQQEMEKAKHGESLLSHKIQQRRPSVSF